MPWVPIHESGIGFSFAAENGPEIDGSTISTEWGGNPVAQWWSIEIPDGPKRIRVLVLSMDTGPYEYGGWFEFDSASPILPERSPPTVSPNPVEPESAISSVTYHAGEQSDYPAESYSMRVEVLMELTANDDDATTSMNTPVTVNVLGNDTLGDEPVALDQLEGPPTIHQQPANGTVSVAPDGKITYTPNPGFIGTDEFVYRIAMADPKPGGCITSFYGRNGDGSGNGVFMIDLESDPYYADVCDNTLRTELLEFLSQENEGSIYITGLAEYSYNNDAMDCGLVTPDDWQEVSLEMYDYWGSGHQLVWVNGSHDFAVENERGYFVRIETPTGGVYCGALWMGNGV